MSYWENTLQLALPKSEKMMITALHFVGIPLACKMATADDIIFERLLAAQPVSPPFTTLYQFLTQCFFFRKSISNFYLHCRMLHSIGMVSTNAFLSGGFVVATILQRDRATSDTGV